MLELIQKALSLAEERASDPPYQYWLNGSECEKNDIDQGPSYCKKCGEKELKKLRRKKAYRAAFLDGGNGGFSMEDDTPASCESCHCLLHFDLISPEDELDAWEGVGPSESLYDLNSGDDRYIVAEILRWAEYRLLWPDGSEVREYEREKHLQLVMRCAFLAQWILDHEAVQ